MIQPSTARSRLRSWTAASSRRRCHSFLTWSTSATPATGWRLVTPPFTHNAWSRACGIRTRPRSNAFVSRRLNSRRCATTTAADVAVSAKFEFSCFLAIPKALSFPLFCTRFTADICSSLKKFVFVENVIKTPKGSPVNACSDVDTKVPVRRSGLGRYPWWTVQF